MLSFEYAAGSYLFWGKGEMNGVVPQAARSRWEKAGELQRMNVEPGGGVGAFMVKKWLGAKMTGPGLLGVF